MKRLQNETNQRHSPISLMNRDGKNPRHRTKPALPVKANTMPKKQFKKQVAPTGKQGRLYTRKPPKHGCQVADTIAKELMSLEALHSDCVQPGACQVG